MAYKRKTDANHQMIIDLFRSYGCKVFSAHAVGGGFPDLVIAFNDQIRLVEVKDGERPPSQTKLNSAQIKFHEEFKGYVEIVKSSHDVTALIKKWRVK